MVLSEKTSQSSGMHFLRCARHNKVRSKRTRLPSTATRTQSTLASSPSSSPSPSSSSPATTRPALLGPEIIATESYVPCYEAPPVRLRFEPKFPLENPIIGVRDVVYVKSLFSKE